MHPDYLLDSVPEIVQGSLIESMCAFGVQSVPPIRFSDASFKVLEATDKRQIMASFAYRRPRRRSSKSVYL